VRLWAGGRSSLTQPLAALRRINATRTSTRIQTKFPGLKTYSSDGSRGSRKLARWYENRQGRHRKIRGRARADMLGCRYRYPPFSPTLHGEVCNCLAVCSLQMTDKPTFTVHQNPHPSRRIYVYIYTRSNLMPPSSHLTIQFGPPDTNETFHLESNYSRLLCRYNRGARSLLNLPSLLLIK
jgi:hypothetical protein